MKAVEKKIIEKYWSDILSGEFKKNTLPLLTFDEKTDSHREPRKMQLQVQIPQPTRDKLHELSKNSDLLMFILFFSGLSVVLNRYTGIEEITVGTVTPKIAASTGQLIICKNQIPANLVLKDLINQIGKNVSKAFNYGEYSFREVYQKVLVKKNSNEPDIFNVAYIYDRLQSSCQFLEKFDLLFTLSQLGDQMVLAAQYPSHLFAETTVRRFCQNVIHLFNHITENLGRNIEHIDVISPDERQDILQFNNTKRKFETDKTIHELFEEQVRETPDAIALVFEDNRLTYKELNKRANQLAQRLRLKEVRRDTVVGIMQERSIRLIVSILAILKTGGAYLPIDPETPEKRVVSILKDNDCSILLTEEKIITYSTFTALGNIKADIVTPFKSPSRQQIKEFNQLPVPDRSLVKYEKIHQTIGCALAKHTISIQSTRGCPYNCAYCHKIWPKSHQARSAENIFDEIHTSYKAGARRFVFIDDVFNLREKNCRRLFHMIIQRGLDIQLFFPNGLRGDILNKDTIDLMVEAGTVDIALALETASPRLQELIDKKLNLEKFEENVHYLTTTYPNVILEMEMIVGFPTETEEEAMKTLDFLKRQKWVHFPNLHILKVYHNTDVFRLAVNHGVLEQKIEESTSLAYHELPETLPFSKSFVRQFQTQFVNDYVLSKERLMHVFPHQMKILTEDELVEKYNSYLPMEINSFADLLETTGISMADLGGAELMTDDSMAVPDYREAVSQFFPAKIEDPDAFRVFLVDLSQLFLDEAGDMLYDVIEEPLGLMYLMTYLNREFGSRISGKVTKSRVDFENLDQLKELLLDYKPHLIGIRTLTFYKEFFHRTVSAIRQWGIDVPIISGGPYATSDYNSILMDPNVDLVVLGEGELTFTQLIGKMMANSYRLPAEGELEKINGIAFIKKKDKQQLSGKIRDIFMLDELSEALEQLPGENLQNINHTNDLLYLISTSGSTGKPKSVMIEHRNLANLLNYQFNETDIDFSTKILQFTTISFDVSAQEIFSALLSGGEIHLVSQNTKNDILSLFEVIEKNDICILFLPPSVLKFIFEDRDFAYKFPASVRHIIVAGEQLVVPPLLRTYMQTHQVFLHNHYGPAETHVVTSYTMAPGQVLMERPPIGKPISNAEIYILNTAQDIQPIGVNGELYIGGANVGRGYYNRIELTREKFVVNPLNKEEEEILYRTGDVARWLEDGNIEFLGRVDYQVKIRGFRIEPEEIEKHLADIDGINKAAVVVQQNERDEKILFAYFTADEEMNDGELKKILARTLPDYMVPSFFIQLEKMPLTLSGKIDRKSLKAPGAKGFGDNYVAPKSHIEKKLVEIWAEVLGIEKHKIGIEDNFFELGGNSLKAIILIAKVRKVFHIKIQLGEIFKYVGIKALAKYITTLEVGYHSSIEPVEQKEYFALSSAQMRLYVVQQIEEQTIAYNMTTTAILEGYLDRTKMADVFRRLISRHESLRTSFETVAGKVVQRIHKNAPFEVQYMRAESDYQGNDQIEAILQHFRQPFDLSQTPLLRAMVLQVEDTKHVLMVDLHHIISDGISMAVFVEEFKILYRGEELPELKLQYKDFSEWQNNLIETGKMTESETFWESVFPGEIPVLNLPFDFERPDMFGFEGSAIEFEIDRTLTAKTLRTSAELDVTLNIYLLAVYYVLLSKYSSQDDIVVGIPIMGRTHIDLQNIIGFFSNMLAMRNRPRADLTFHQLVMEVKENSIKAYDHQEYQFEMLVNRLSIPREAGRHPLVDTVFVLHDNDKLKVNKSSEGIGDLEIKPYEIETLTSHFDIMLHATVSDHVIKMAFEYSNALFVKSTVEKMGKLFINILEQVVENKHLKLEEIAITHELIAAKLNTVQDSQEDWNLKASCTMGFEYNDK
jgi:amino acid adenylation domain-containing protein